jgi:hypothetical protein
MLPFKYWTITGRWFHRDHVSFTNAVVATNSRSRNGQQGQD